MSPRKRRLGRTGLMVSEVGLGAMDTPGSPQAVETVATALDLGIDFIDTARGYEGSEYLLGRVIRERGARKLRIATKTFSRTVNGSQWDVDNSLRVLGVERIDLYQLHDVSTGKAWEEVMGERGALAGLKAARERGAIDYIGVSSHNLELAHEAVLCGQFDTLMVEHSAFYPDSAPLIELAAAHDVGVIVMRPLGGSGRMSAVRGLVAEGRAGILTPANLLRYVLSNPAVSVAIPGASYPSRVVENVATSAGFAPLTEAERRELEAAAALLY